MFVKNIPISSVCIINYGYLLLYKHNNYTIPKHVANLEYFIYVKKCFSVSYFGIIIEIGGDFHSI